MQWGYWENTLWEAERAIFSSCNQGNRFTGCALESGMPWAGCCGWQGNPGAPGKELQGIQGRDGAGELLQGGSSDTTPPVWGKILALKCFP